MHVGQTRASKAGWVRTHKGASNKPVFDHYITFKRFCVRVLNYCQPQVAFKRGLLDQLCSYRTLILMLRDS